MREESKQLELGEGSQRDQKPYLCYGKTISGFFTHYITPKFFFHVKRDLLAQCLSPSPAFSKSPRVPGSTPAWNGFGWPRAAAVDPNTTYIPLQCSGQTLGAYCSDLSSIPSLSYF